MPKKSKERKGPKQIRLEPEVEDLYEETEALYKHITGRKFFGYRFANIVIEKGLLKIREELGNAGQG